MKNHILVYAPSIISYNVYDEMTTEIHDLLFWMDYHMEIVVKPVYHHLSLEGTSVVLASTFNEFIK